MHFGRKCSGRGRPTATTSEVESVVSALRLHGIAFGVLKQIDALVTSVPLGGRPRVATSEVESAVSALRLRVFF